MCIFNLTNFVISSLYNSDLIIMEITYLRLLLIYPSTPSFAAILYSHRTFLFNRLSPFSSNQQSLSIRQELETTIEMFHELHKRHNEMQDHLNLEIQQLRVQLYLRPPSTDEDEDDLSDADDLDNRSHSLTSNLSPVCRKQQWRMDRGF